MSEVPNIKAFIDREAEANGDGDARPIKVSVVPPNAYESDEDQAAGIIEDGEDEEEPLTPTSG